MKNIIIFSVLLISQLSFAQELKVVRICDITDSVSNVNFAVDINGKTCSIVKVSAGSINDITFSGMIIGDVKQTQDGSYFLNIPERTKHINYRHQDFLPGVIDFWGHGISVNGGKAYHVIMASQKSETVSTQKGSLQYLIFKFDVPIESLVVNGTQWNISNNQSKKLVYAGHYAYVAQAGDKRIIKGEVDVKNNGISKVVNVKFTSELHE